MKRRWGLSSALIVLTLAASQAIGFGAKRASLSEDEALYRESDLFADAMKIVRSDYVEEPEPKRLIYGALKGMLATLDPYSQFMDPDSYNELKIDTGGEFGGLGIEVTIKEDLLTVIAPIDDTPAFHAGILAGDRIVKIDGDLTRGITLMDAVKQLRGKPNTTVKLTILREGETALKELTLTRTIIKIQSIREATLLEEHIGYIRLSDFREHTTDDLESNLKRLLKDEINGLILDLRNNPGGLLDVSVSVSELFLLRQQLIVSTKGRLRNQNQDIYSRADGLAKDVPLVVLINEGSASASEIVAGAMQDHHRGIVMGTKSHGKASVQTIFPLKDGSALRLTTSKYFTPKGRSIHGQGIIPDVEVPLERPKEEEGKANKESSEDIFERLESKEEEPSEPHVVKKPLDNQLARAVDLLKGIQVYRAREKEHAIN